MDKKTNVKGLWARICPSRRRLIQLYAALLYNAHLKGWIQGEIYTGPLKMLCVPGLNCYSCPGAVGACPLGALQNALAASGARAPWYMLGILLLFGLTLGRTICGWLCPFGLIQELLHKLPTPKLRKSRVTRVLSYGKYLVLLFLVLLVPLASTGGLPVPAFCKYLCPAGTLEGAVGLLAHPANASLRGMLGGLFANKLILLIGILLACVFIFRAFCRFLCPLGAIYGLFARLSLLGVQVDADRCTNCGRCVRACGMDIRHVGDHECIHCGACASVCAEQAIHWQAGPVRIEAKAGASAKRRTGLRVLAALLALALLSAVLFTVNRGADERPVIALGEVCPDFRLTLLGKEEPFTLSAQRGHPVVLNFWATWCAPCVRELPLFEALQAEAGDSVCVLAVHTGAAATDVQAFLQKRGLTLSAALDPDSTLFELLGGGALLPMTVILDTEGRLLWRLEGAVTEALLRDALAGLPAAQPEAPAEEAVTYTLRVMGAAGVPLPGVMLQVCDDSSCRLCTTGADGTAAFTGKPYAWEVHVMKVPAGYAAPAEDLCLPEAGGEVTIVLAPQEMQ